MDFRTELKKRRLVLDGSMGALLQNRGLPAGMAPDVWMLNNESVIERAHKEYADAGADILLTNTFGASRWRLAEYDAYSQIRKINAKAIELARRSIGNRGFVAGDIGPSGETVFPTGHKSFEEVCEIFYEQAKILVEEGVDLIVVETMFDSLEFRAACSAVRAASGKIPLVAHATFNTDAITDTGATPENIVAIAEGFHADAVGVNCSTGPDAMLSVVRRMALVSNIRVSVQPNAGLPKIQNGKTVFPLGAQEMRPFVEKFFEAGASIVGGCCGTTPEYISYVKELALKTQVLNSDKPSRGVLISGLNQYATLGGSSPFLPIGERMNPSGRKKLSESLKKSELDLLLQDAELQVQSGAKALDLNVGVPMVDEPELMKRAVVAVQNKYGIPLMIDSSNSFALDKGSSVYYGRPLLNSLNAEEEKLHEALPIMKKHGAAVVCMLTGVDVPVSAEERLENAKRMLKILFAEGFQESDIVFDCLGLVVSAMQEGSINTLKTIDLMKEHFPRAATTLGLSNVSFGLPNRTFVHGAFLAIATQRGLDSAIMSVTDPVGKALAASADMWSAKENSIHNFVQNWYEKIHLGVGAVGGSSALLNTAKKTEGPQEPEWLETVSPIRAGVFRGIVEGQKGEVEKLVKEFAQTYPEQAMDLFIQVMTPAIRHLGDLFAARVKFIPHLISAADAMKTGVGILEPLLIEARSKAGKKAGTIVFATVKGDIHDIGKNICILMLRNFGFEVIDLGRNVDSELILQTAIEKKAEIIALSALMTTTMMQMKVVIDAVRDRKIPCKVVIGGAVVTPEFAREIQADGYSTDVGTVVSEIERVLSLLKVANLA